MPFGLEIDTGESLIGNAIGRWMSSSSSWRLKSLFCLGGSKPRSRRAASRFSLAECVSRGVGARVLFAPREVGEAGRGTGMVSRILGVKNFRIDRVLESERWAEFDLKSFF